MNDFYIVIISILEESVEQRRMWKTKYSTHGLSGNKYLGNNFVGEISSKIAFALIFVMQTTAESTQPKRIFEDVL